MLDLFSSEIMIEFLGANYVVWPWDISLERNRQMYVYEIHKLNLSISSK
jgi:hypothetical protein